MKNKSSQVQNRNFNFPVWWGGIDFFPNLLSVVKVKKYVGRQQVIKR